jgi:hypothetical protein
MDVRTYLTIILECDGTPGAAVQGARSAVWPAQTSDERRISRLIVRQVLV